MAGGDAEPVETFLDQIITGGIGFNFAYYRRSFLNRFNPDWAKNLWIYTVMTHVQTILLNNSKMRTDDELWNAAQRQLIVWESFAII